MFNIEHKSSFFIQNRRNNQTFKILSIMYIMLLTKLVAGGVLRSIDRA